MARKKYDEDDDIEVAEIRDDDEDEYEDEDEVEYEGWSFGKKALVIFVVIIIIIAAGVSIFYFDKDVMDIYISPPIELDDGSGIRIEAYVSLEGATSASGKGNLKILFGGEEQYSASLNFNNDRGVKEVKYSEFIYDSGSYDIVVSYGDKSKTYPFNPFSTYNFGFAKHVNITLSLSPNELTLMEDRTQRGGTINIVALASIKEIKYTDTGIPYEVNPYQPPSDTNLEIEIEHEDGSSDTYDQDLEGEATTTFNEFVYYSSGSGPGPGNYTVTATITNNNVKQSSPNHEIVLENIAKKYLNFAPIADAGDNDQDSTSDTSITFQFDGSNSWNDGEITLYMWDFDFDETEGFVEMDSDTSPTISHTYDKMGVGAYTETHHVALYIQGKRDKDQFEYSVVDEIEVTIQWTIF